MVSTEVTHPEDSFSPGSQTTDIKCLGDACWGPRCRAGGAVTEAASHFSLGQLSPTPALPLLQATPTKLLSCWKGFCGVLCCILFSSGRKADGHPLAPEGDRQTKEGLGDSALLSSIWVPWPVVQPEQAVRPPVGSPSCWQLHLADMGPGWPGRQGQDPVCTPVLE